MTPSRAIWFAALGSALMGAAPAPAASENLSGSIAGMVNNSLGIPQMGATVILFNHLDRQVARTLTDDRGVFQFDSLPADLYRLKVSLASFVPAVRNNISVQPGIRRVLSINLTGLLSTIELVYSLPVQQGLMSDEWKWALRGSLATRPILRVLGDSSPSTLSRMNVGSGVFAHTRGMLRLSAGDASSAPTLGSQPDLGTAFALATSFLGTNHLEFNGNLGYAAGSGNPAAGFRTSFRRGPGDGQSPEVAVIMRQIFLAGRTGSSLATGRADSLPALQTLSVGLSDKLQIADNILVTYGSTLESVSFLNRLNYFSPYLKVGYGTEQSGILEFGYSSGLPPTHLYSGMNPQGDPDTQQDLAQLALFPRVSMRNGRPEVQRARNMEVGFHKKMGSRTVSGGAYRESIANAAVLATGAAGAFRESEVLPDLFSTATVLNVGRYQTVGYMVAVQQELWHRWSMAVAYGSSGVLEAGKNTIQAADMQELRDMVAPKRRQWMTTRVAGVLPQTSTRFSASYQWFNGHSLTPGHFYMTQPFLPSQGLNVHVRQPIPAFSGMPAKLEATAEIRNILAQGYQDVQLDNGRRIQLVHTPRALRGGLAFIF